MGFKTVRGIYKYIIESQSNRGQKFYRLMLAVGWQLYKRVVGLPIISSLDNGAKFILHPNSTNSTGNIYVKTYEAEYIYFLRQHIKPGGIILDVGAHMGLYTLLLKDNFEGGYLFEPAEDNFAALKTNLFINGLDSKFIPLQSLVSDKNGVLSFNVDGKFSGTNRISSEGDTNLVNSVSVDGYLNSINNSSPISLLKIDTEGHEMMVLRGSEETIKSNPDLILIIENSETGNIISFLENLDFTVYAISKKGKLSSEKKNLDKAYNLIAFREH